jgi:5-formyltetrahydrofolate cyclo-ligase
MEPAAIRDRIKRQRRSLSSNELAQHGSSVCAHIKKQAYYLNSSKLAIYLPVQGEISPLALVDHARKLGKHIYLPILSPLASKGLWFVKWSAHTRFQMNRFGIPEPQYAAKDLLPAQNLDLVFTPLVAFDEHCHRIGMGGGFYDRTFSFLLARKYWIKPQLIGLAHDFQKIKAIHPQAWDIPLQGVVTERAFYAP